MDKERYTRLKRLVRYYNEHDETKGASKFLFERLAWEISRLPFKDFCMTSDYLPRPGVRSINDENYKPNPDEDEMEINFVIMFDDYTLSITGSIPEQPWDRVVFSIHRKRILLVSDFLPIEEVINTILDVRKENSEK